MVLLDLLLLLVAAQLTLCATSCEYAPRTLCKNLRSSGDCDYERTCLPYWKNSKWVRYADDLSAKCTYCLHFGELPMDTDAASRICNISGLSHDACTRFLQSWWPNNRNENNTVAFCNVLSMCDSHTYLGDLNFGGSVCEDCKQILEDVRKLLADKATIEAVTDKLNQVVCAHTPSAIREYCEQTVKAHVPSILHLLEIQIKPQDLCSLVGLCLSDKPYNVTINDLIPEDKPAYVNHQSTHTPCEDDIVPWYYERLRLSSSNTQAKPSCDECKSVLGQIRTVLNDPGTRDRIKKNIDEQFCSQFPSFLQTACDEAVNSHFDEIINNLNKTDLGQVCAIFGMCPSIFTPTINSIQQTPLQPGIPVPGVCQICEVVVDKVIVLVVGDLTERSIARALEQLCMTVPRFYKSRCEKFMDQYGAKIIEAIIEHTAPKLVCATVGVCGPVAVAEKPTSLQMQPKIEPCSTCKLLVTVIQQQLELNQTKDGLEKAIKHLCGVLPGSYGEECKNLVDIYLPSVIDFLSRSMTSEQICEEIGLCQSKDELTTLDKNIEPLCQSTDLDVVCLSLEVARQCDLLDACMIYRQARYLIDNLSAPDVTTSGCTVCAEVVNRWKLFKRLYGRIFENGQSCVNYKDQQERTLCDLVVANRIMIQRQLMDSTISTVELCQDFKLCANHPSRPHSGLHLDKSTQALIATCSMDFKVLCASKRLASLCGKRHFCEAFGPTDDTPLKPKDIFGQDACKWGPTYYCQNEETAQRCGSDAVKHCREKIWTTEAPIVSSDVPMLGKNPCTWSPTYWCSSEELARSCGPRAVEHCRKMSLLRK